MKDGDRYGYVAACGEMPALSCFQTEGMKGKEEEDGGGGGRGDEEEEEEEEEEKEEEEEEGGGEKMFHPRVWFALRLFIPWAVWDPARLRPLRVSFRDDVVGDGGGGEGGLWLAGRGWVPGIGAGGSASGLGLSLSLRMVWGDF